MSDFGRYFKESMDSVGAPCPASLFESIERATITVTRLVAVVAKFGTRVTLTEVLMTSPGTLPSAAFLGEVGIAASGVTAAAYCGCCLGALFYATQRSLGLDLLSVSNMIDNMLENAAKAGIRVPIELNQDMRSRGAVALIKTSA